MTGSSQATLSFEQRVWGRFVGVLRWPQLEALWGRVGATSSGWYIYDVEVPPPVRPAATEELIGFLKRVDKHLRQEHEHEYCGIVYVDDLRQPSLIKIYDPSNLGAVCGPSGHRVLPRWVISRVQPCALREYGSSDLPPMRWWRRIFRSVGG